MEEIAEEMFWKGMKRGYVAETDVIRSGGTRQGPPVFVCSGRSLYETGLNKPACSTPLISVTPLSYTSLHISSTISSSIQYVTVEICLFLSLSLSLEQRRVGDAEEYIIRSSKRIYFYTNIFNETIF